MHDRLDRLRDPRTLRARCAAITAAVADERSGWFRLDRGRLPDAAARVVSLMRRRFPDLRIPYHSRWRHFEAGGVDRKVELDAAMAGRAADDRTRAQFDLTVVSVLLDAGAGAEWGWVDRTEALPATALPAEHVGRDELLAMLDRAAGGSSAPTGARAEGPAPAPSATPQASTPQGQSQRYTRSEGLAVAGFRAFMAGAFSSTPGDPCRVDAQALRQIDVAVLRAVFQVTPTNPLVGLEGRAALLQRLGAALQAESARDGTCARPALLFERLRARGASQLAASDILHEVLRATGSIWTSGSRVMGVLAGDVWPHRWAGSATAEGDDAVTRGWVPFHKLSQWLSWSLIEPLQWAGLEVTGLEALTGLPEYRNGGLLIDTGVVVPRSASFAERRWKPGDEFIVEWRALTVTLLDELAAQVRDQLGLTASQLPLACVLEGGTWAAGREIAAELRRGGAPPLLIDSDGTVF